MELDVKAAVADIEATPDLLERVLPPVARRRRSLERSRRQHAVWT